MDRGETLDLLAKAFGGKLSAGDRALALEDASDVRAEFTGLMQQAFPAYEETRKLYDELIAVTGPTRKAELVEQRKHLRARTAYNLRVHFNRYYRDAFQAGKRTAGNGRPLQANEKQILRELVNNEVEYALNALIDAETGEYSMPLDRRGTLYGQALGEAQWLGFLYADLSQDRFVRWVEDHDDVENCADCSWLSGSMSQVVGALHYGKAAMAGAGGRWGNGVYRVQQLAAMGVVPQSAKLACTTNCHCHLEEVRRPLRRPHGPELKTWTSLAPKTPTMLNRGTEVATRERLAELADTHEHVHVKRR